MNDEYQTRAEHGVKHFHEVVFGGNGKPVAITLTEPDKSEIRFFKKTDKPKVTEVKL